MDAEANGAALIALVKWVDGGANRFIHLSIEPCYFLHMDQWFHLKLYDYSIRGDMMPLASGAHTSLPHLVRILLADFKEIREKNATR